ncbi:MAG TPA: hypothetical protein VJM32_04805 [Candidatus Saccharimonadales bacterium]|nr:hypothetical protein [Candidatus Saccharimonadales bacterium]
MRQIITVLAALIPIAGAIPYLINTVKDKTRPNIVTWFTWTLINGINTAAAFSDGAWQTAIYTGAGTIATGAIVAVGVKHGFKKYTPFDIACQIVALLGIPLWLLTGQPELAVLILLVVDFAGGLPTLRHAFKAPREETWQTFGASALGGALILVSLERFDVVALTMPLYIFLFDLTVLLTIFWRRRKVKT